MTTRATKKTGRPSKGPRHAFNVKLPAAEAEKVQLLSQVHERTYQDTIEPLLVAALANVDLDELRSLIEGQGRLDVAV